MNVACQVVTSLQFSRSHLHLYRMNRKQVSIMSKFLHVLPWLLVSLSCTFSAFYTIIISFNSNVFIHLFRCYSFRFFSMLKFILKCFWQQPPSSCACSSLSSAEETELRILSVASEFFQILFRFLNAGFSDSQQEVGSLFNFCKLIPCFSKWLYLKIFVWNGNLLVETNVVGKLLTIYRRCS